METTTLQRKDQKYQSWLGILALILFALLYCWSALVSPFWNDNDTWSNLLPVIHFRHSILEQHALPLYTDLWYGGRAQWANPLWNFLYLPSTIVWVVTPLDWGTRIVFLGHLIFSLLSGRWLAGLFLDSEFERISAAILFTSPILVALTAGHVEKVMSWGWVLLALYFLLNRNLTSRQRGLGAGICLGIIPLTGANYYAFYAGILISLLAISYKDLKLFLFFGLGSLIGLLHLPTVWQMAGHARSHAEVFIKAYSVSLLNSLSALSVGFSKPLSWETWTPVGILTIYLFGLILVMKTRATISKKKFEFSLQELALLLSIFLLLLLSSGLAYRGQNWFNLFRVPARALAFVALAIVLFVLMNARGLINHTRLKQTSLRLFLFTSAVQIAASAWVIRPEGSKHSPYQASVQHVADILKADNAKSIWFSTRALDDMYIHVGLTRNDLALPNVYYGDMGQNITAMGSYCSYSFDHVIAFAPIEGSTLQLLADTEWSVTDEEIPLDKLSLLERVKLDDRILNIYRVICS